MKMKSVHIIICSLITIILYKQIHSKPILNNSESELDTVEQSSRYLKENQMNYNSNKRWKRGYFYGYEYKGPYSPHDSDEYESDSPESKNIDETLKEGGYADLESEPDIFPQAKDIDEVFLTTSVPDSSENDGIYPPAYSYDPPKIQEDKKESVTKKPAPPPNTSYDVPISTVTVDDDNKNEDIEPNQELISIADKHIKELIEGNAKTEESVHKYETSTLKPNLETSVKKEVSILTSYGAPLSSVTGYPPYEISNNKPEENNNKKQAGPPATSYGIPDKKIIGYPKYVIAEDNTINEADNKESKKGGPPATSYGVPDKPIIIGKNATINKDSDSKKKGPPATSYGVPNKPIIIVEDASDSKDSESIKEGPPATSYGVPDKPINLGKNANPTPSIEHPHSKREDAKPYDLIRSSYGAPLKSVTTLENVTLTESIGIPDAKIKTKFHTDDKASTSIEDDGDSDAKASSKKFITISMEDYKLISVCMEKSQNSAFTLNKDGSLVKE